MAHSPEWLLNVEKLNTYAHVFTGRRIVILRTGEGIEDPEKVKAAFGFDAEFILMPNSKGLQEVAGFLETLGSLKSLNPNEITFYAHTKGVKYDKNDPKIPSIRVWRDAMYEGCLSDIERIDEALRTYACCGCFKQYAADDCMWGTWTFAGTFWWVNHAELFSSPEWQVIAPSIYGTEAYLGRVFPSEKAFCLVGEITEQKNLYRLLRAPRKPGLMDILSKRFVREHV
jgi:hypothetical protein